MKSKYPITKVKLSSVHPHQYIHMIMERKQIIMMVGKRRGKRNGMKALE